VRSSRFEWSDDHHALAVAALQFFCLESDLQESHWRSLPADMQVHDYFRLGAGQSNGSDYFFGIGSVYITYHRALRERFKDEHALDLLTDFGHRLDVMMCNAMREEDTDAWTPAAAATEVPWQKLRANANAARLALGLALPATLPALDICELVEAPPSEEVRQLLDP
jgi:hypothetical protein